jgi:hypothetical protein
MSPKPGKQGGTPRTLRDLIVFAEANGWRVVPSARQHPLFYSPDGETIVTGSGTPSDFRSLRNLIALLRRAGLDVPH